MTSIGALSGDDIDIANVVLLVSHFRFAHMCHMTLAICVNNMVTSIEGAAKYLLFSRRWEEGQL